MKNKLIAVCGPTAVGKTETAIRLAETFNCPILSFDSRQFYYELKIGAAIPNEEELKRAQHFFIADRSVTQPLNSGSFADEAELLLKKLFEIYPVIIAVGGSGLYLKAFIDGVDELPKSDEIRKEISLELKEKGLEKLVQEIKERDPVIAKQIDIQNPVRVSRYLEILRISNKPILEIKKKAKVNFFETIYLGLNIDRELLYDRINLRTDLMIKQGLEEEAYNLLKYKNLQSLQTVGYKEWWDYFNHKTNKEETIDLIKQNSRNYAKRQITWFKNQTHCEWFEPKQFEQILDYINKSLAG